MRGAKRGLATSGGFMERDSGQNWKPARKCTSKPWECHCMLLITHGCPSITACSTTTLHTKQIMSSFATSYITNCKISYIARANITAALRTSPLLVMVTKASTLPSLSWVEELVGMECQLSWHMWIMGGRGWVQNNHLDWRKEKIKHSGGEHVRCLILLWQSYQRQHRWHWMRNARSSGIAWPPDTQQLRRLPITCLNWASSWCFYNEVIALGLPKSVRDHEILFLAKILKEKFQ